MKHYRTPAWPSLDEFMAGHPHMLAIVPKRWRRHKLVMLSLSCLLLLAASSRWALGAGQKPASLVAPVFMHGQGAGSFGGIANTAYMLPEDEARKSINAQAVWAGIAFKADCLTLSAVELPETETFVMDGNEFVKGAHRAPLLLDGTDPRRRISYEYLSVDDYEVLRKNTGYGSTVSHYETYRAAAALRDGLVRAKPQGYYGVFYDPLCIDAAKSRAALRQQVQDFISWLKAQGVI